MILGPLWQGMAIADRVSVVGRAVAREMTMAGKEVAGDTAG